MSETRKPQDDGMLESCPGCGGLTRHRPQCPQRPARNSDEPPAPRVAGQTKVEQAVQLLLEHGRVGCSPAMVKLAQEAQVELDAMAHLEKADVAQVDTLEQALLSMRLWRVGVVFGFARAAEAGAHAQALQAQLDALRAQAQGALNALTHARTSAPDVALARGLLRAALSTAPRASGTGEPLSPPVQPVPPAGPMLSQLDVRPTVPPMDPLHPTGRCSCAGEGRCTWCRSHCAGCGMGVPEADPYVARLKEFHEAMDLPVRQMPDVGTDEERVLAVVLMLEECFEFAKARRTAMRTALANVRAVGDLG